MVQPGLSLITSLPWRIASMAIAARSQLIAAVSTSFTVGIFQQAAFVGDTRDVWIALDEAIQRLWFAVGPVADALAAVFKQPPGHFIHVAMIEPDRGEFDTA